MKVTILMVGDYDKKITQSLTDNKDYEMIAVVDTEAAIEKWHHNQFEIIVLSNSLSEEEKTKLSTIGKHQFPDTQFIHFSGADAATLMAEIKKAMEERNSVVKNNYSFVDDAFKGFHASE